MKKLLLAGVSVAVLGASVGHASGPQSASAVRFLWGLDWSRRQWFAAQLTKWI